MNDYQNIQCLNENTSPWNKLTNPIELKPYGGIIEIKNELNVSDYWAELLPGEHLNQTNPKILISGDYNIFESGWDGYGVYACSGNYISKTFKTPWYIGSVWGKNGLRNRIENEHIRGLQNNCHPHNILLQNAWNKHGQENFIWWLLEECHPKESTFKEQYYLNLYRPFVDEFNGFNISHFVYSPSKGRITSEETKQKISKSKKGKLLPEQHRANQSKAAKKRFSDPHNHPFFGKKWTKSALQKRSESKKKQAVVVSPEGDVVKIKGVGQFCEENGFADGFYDMINGKILHYRGWRLLENKDLEDLEPLSEKRRREGRLRAIVKSPSGEIVNIDGVHKFCQSRNLNASSFTRMVYGKSRNCNGWILIELLHKPTPISKWKNPSKVAKEEMS